MQQQNPLNKFFNNNNNNMPQVKGNNPMEIANEFMKFAKEFQGNPKMAEQEVMNLLSNGQMSQAQFNQLTNFAKQIQPMLNSFGIKL